MSLTFSFLFFQKELQGQINEKLQTLIHDQAKVKSMGGKRLQIEESDESDEEEDVEEKLENIILNNAEKPASIQVKDKFTGQKTSIKM